MIYDLSNLTLNPEEANQVSQAIFETVLEQSDIAKHHEIQSGIEHQTQIPFIGTLGLVGKKIIACQRDANGNQIPMSEKFWNPQHIGDRFEHCSTDLNPLFKLFRKAVRMNPDYFDRLDSEEFGVVAMRIEQAIKEMITRLTWFGDTSIENVSNAGYLKNGEDTSFFDIIDGLWPQIIGTDIPTTSNYYVEIAQNAEATKVLQQTLPTDFAYNLFKTMWTKADSRLKQLVMNNQIELQLHVTGDIYENYQDFKETKSLEFTLKNVEDGGLKSFFRNVEVIPHYDWDAIIQGYFDNGTTYHLPNRALLTTPSNIPIGTRNEGDLTQLESFYDQY